MMAKKLRKPGVDPRFFSLTPKRAYSGEDARTFAERQRLQQSEPAGGGRRVVRKRIAAE